MVDFAPYRWSTTFTKEWYLVDSLIVISDIDPQNSYMLTSHDNVEVRFDSSGWVLFREPDGTSGGAFPPDRVLGIVWAVP